MGKPLSATTAPIVSLRITGLEIRQLEVEAVVHAAKGNFVEAVDLLRKATALDDSLPPPSGPPSLIKPAHELLGDVLLRAGRPKEAAQQSDISQLREPSRARSLMGAARAAATLGDAEAADVAYANS